ncbi:tyrosine-type recombinase/integrase [Endozoicomonas sp. SCSIO W0465]|uniref:tyrosine-type recombinase/integrase n=1 Tax=Endozoicomonas sp. SCSIO W0465 TaxID=2918516 RepID=UPI002074F906|nr:tyrosine-type recombinase/integrase [Endozoicomonas sp. SCSIO W0465]USE33921.1 tyrosine-type recombinase/integrase [Endozoicomonas sp. SCSIO W0465]
MLAELFDRIDKNSGLMTGMKRLFDRYEQEVVPTLGTRTQKDKKEHLKRLWRSFGHMEPDQITTAMVQAYVDLRGKSSPSQANQEASTLSQALRRARVWGMMNSANPVDGIIRHQLKPRERLPTLAELEVFKHHASPFIAAYTELKLEIGLRQEDLLNLNMKKHFFDDGIRVRTGKTGKRLFFPWTDHLRSVVARIRSFNKVDSDYLMCGRDGLALKKGTFSDRWKQSMAKALSAEEGPLLERFHEHDIRATHATLVEEKVGVEAASTNLGHDNVKTTRMYLRSKKYERTVPFSELVNDSV